MYAAAGFVLALAVSALAWRRSGTSGGFYDRDVYAMGRVAHRRYAAVSLLFAGYFGVAYSRGWEAAGIAGLALYALIAVLYATSFLQGAHDRDD